MLDEYFVYLLMLLALMLFISYLLHHGLDKLRMPNLLAPLLVGLVFQSIPQLSPLTSVASGEAYYFLAQLGIILLLFLVGFQLDIEKLRSLSKYIAILSVSNLAFSSILGFLILMSYGYPLLVSLLVSTALATVAETTVAPILYEIGVIKTEAASLILGSGVVDDVAEVMIASLASMMVGTEGEAVDPLLLVGGLCAFAGFALFFNVLVLPFIKRFDKKPRDSHAFLLIISTVLAFTAFSHYFRLGILLGAIVGGFTFQRFLNRSNSKSEAFKKPLLLSVASLRGVTFGLLGPIFFFGIGLGFNLSSLAESFSLMLLLLAANFIGKFVGAFMVGKMAKMNLKTIAVIGLGLSAKFSMGIIPVQIFYSAGVIDQQLFSAFIAVSTITTLTIPFSLAYIINRWRPDVT